MANFFSKLSTNTTDTTHIYFYGAKMKLRGSKNHITVEIVRKRPKRRHFGHEMTSYIEVAVRYDKILFFNIFYS